MKTVPLPSGPASLCFDKDEFMKVCNDTCSVRVLLSVKSRMSKL